MILNNGNQNYFVSGTIGTKNTTTNIFCQVVNMDYELIELVNPDFNGNIYFLSKTGLLYM